MSDPDDAVPGDRYTPAEIEGFRARLRRGNADARAELERRGHPGTHPRIQALKEAGLWPPSQDAPGTSAAADRDREG